MFVWLTVGETGKTILAISELLKPVYGYSATYNSGLQRNSWLSTSLLHEELTVLFLYLRKM